MLNDLRYALRGLGRNPALGIAAILTLALGLGVNTTVFSVADAYFLRPLPGRNPSQLVRLTSHTPQGEDNSFSYPDYRDIGKECSAFSGVLAYSAHAGFLRTRVGSPLIAVDWVSPNYFSVLGVDAFHGRTFSRFSVASPQPTIVLSYAVWQGDFGGDPTLVGKTVTLTGKSYTVIGITPPSFRGLTRIVPAGAWLTIDEMYRMHGSAILHDRGFRDFSLVARLRQDSSPGQARAQLTTIATRLADAYPVTNAARSFGVVSESQRLRKGLAPTGLLLALAGLVLLIACANVAGLLVAQSETRRREIAVRLAVGASRWRLVRQMLTEGALLGLAGAAAAILIAAWLIRLQPAVMPPFPIEVGANLQINAPVAIFTFAVALIAILIFGLMPALPASKTDVITALKSDGGRSGARSGRHRMRSVFVVSEVALAVVLMSGAGLLLKSLIRATHEDLGFDAHEKLLVADLSPGVNGQHGEQSWRYFEGVSSKVSALPGVKKVTVALHAPLSPYQSGVAASVSIPGVKFPQGQPTIDIQYNSVAPNYFRTVGTTIVEGRGFRASDRPDTPKVAIVDKTMAQRFWPSGNAIGKVIEVDRVPFQIVGIAENAKVNSIHEAPQPHMYFVFSQKPASEADLIVETGPAPGAMEKTIRDTIRFVNPNVPMLATTMGQLMKRALWGDRTTAEFVGSLGLLGIFLAAIGLYGVVAYLVNGRTQEIGLRMALGAQRSEVLRLVVGQGLKLAALGAGVGVVLALGTMRFMASLLHGVNPDDPVPLGISCIFAVAIALAASYTPARRAMRVDPTSALRAE